MLDVSTLLPEFRNLLAEERMNELGPGTPNTEMATQLRQAQQDLAASPKARDRNALSACFAGLWLYHDFFEESHIISQDLDTPEGSYWHAILHRREPDASNARYWFRRVGSHPVVAQLTGQAPSLGYRYTDPFAFVDFVERVRGTHTPDEIVAKRVQQLEWQLLFEHCYTISTCPNRLKVCPTSTD